MAETDVEEVEDTSDIGQAVLVNKEYQSRQELAAKMRSERADADEKTVMSDSVTENLAPTKVSDIKVAGIEGGGTHSSLIVMDSVGHELVHVKGPGTNHWSLGMKEAAARINSMIEKAKGDLGISKTHPFNCVGLCLSGCEEEESNQQLVALLHKEFPNASKEYVVDSDTMGSLKTGSGSGGIVLIAGTGSNARLINPDGSTHTCGGWGHVLGDEGSAYWIAHRACKYVINDMDNLEKSPQPISYVWPAMRTFFHIAHRNEILPHFYSNFSKSRLALFTKELANGCVEKDPLCELLFTDSGRVLARHILALYGKAQNELKMTDRGIKIICVGSVWKSWDSMKKGFVEEIGKNIDELTLLRLKVPSAIGACYMAADKLKLDSFAKNYEGNSEAFFYYKRNNLSTNGQSIAAIDALYESRLTTSVSSNNVHHPPNP